MILRTDLYAAVLHEDRLTRNQKAVRESPSYFLIGFVILLLGAGAAHYLFLQQMVKRLRPQSEELATKAATAQKDLQEANLRLLAQQKKVARRTALLSFADHRLSWAPVLETLYATTPPQIELTRIHGSCFFSQSATLQISGKTATRNSRLDCDKYRLLLIQALSDTGIAAEGKFARLEDVDSGNKSAGNTFLITEFTIELTWKIQANGK